MPSAMLESKPLSLVFEQDETAWLEIMSNLAAEGRYAEIDYPNLSEYLADMAKRDRREVSSRLVTLLTHLLKWEHQPDRRSGSWQGTILKSVPEQEVSFSFDHLNGEPPSTVHYRIEPQGELVQLTIIHEDFQEVSEIRDRVKNGWPSIIALP